MEYEGKRRLLEIGETIDASHYENIISFYGKTEAEILIKMTAENFEPGFFETQILQEEADAIAELDGYTYMHCNRIKDYSIEVWTHLELPKEKLSILRWGAYFHDIGKRVVPLEILNKPGKLTAEEWEIMKTHTTEGAKIMREHTVEWLEMLHSLSNNIMKDTTEKAIHMVLKAMKLHWNPQLCRLLMHLTQ